METEDLTKLPRSVREAKALGAKRYYTGVPCKRGHLEARFTSTRKCYACARIYCKHAYETKENYRGRSKIWYWANRERSLAKQAEWRAANPEIAAAASAAWTSQNMAKVIAYQNIRRARKLRATPAWVSLEDFVEIYSKREQLSKETGIMYHADHIVPLKHPLVCGLHVPWNLQLLTRSENCSKNNRFEVG